MKWSRPIPYILKNASNPIDAYLYRLYCMISFPSEFLPDIHNLLLQAMRYFLFQSVDRFRLSGSQVAPGFDWPKARLACNAELWLRNWFWGSFSLIDFDSRLGFGFRFSGCERAARLYRAKAWRTRNAKLWFGGSFSLNNFDDRLGEGAACFYGSEARCACDAELWVWYRNRCTEDGWEDEGGGEDKLDESEWDHGWVRLVSVCLCSVGVGGNLLKAGGVEARDM